MDSILNSIKTMLGGMVDYSDTAFDTELIMHINTVLMELTQLGVGPKEGFYISDDRDTWDDFIPGDTTIEGIKTYIYLKVKLIFDPPSNSFVTESYRKTIAELEWRINSAIDYKLDS